MNVRAFRALFALISIFLLSFNLATVHADDDSSIHTVYHVYMDDNYLGKVSNPSVIEHVINSLVNERKKEYSDYEFTITQKVTYVPEQVFRKKVEDQLVSDKVKNLADIKAVATAITINDEPVVYVKNLEKARNTLENLQKQYVTEKEWVMFKGQELFYSILPPLEKGESRVIDIRIKDEITFDKVYVDAEEILSVKDAVKFLQVGTLEEGIHIIEEGEVLGSIAQKYGLKLKELIELNEGITEDSILQIGQELNVLVPTPLIHVVVEKEVFKEESVPYQTEVVENSSMPKGTTKVKQQGKNGKNHVLYSVVEENGKQVQKVVLEETVVEKPVKKIVEKGTKVIPSAGSGSFVKPTNGGYVSSRMGPRWGSYHKGIDIARPSNYTIKAADHGVVVSAGWHGGYGNKIVIDHKNGFRTVYAHLKSINVKVGQKVEKGQAIGIMGSTGNSTGIHLHFEIYKNGKLQNPLNYVKY